MQPRYPQEMYQAISRLLMIVLKMIRILFKSKDDLIAENLAPHQQLAACECWSHQANNGLFLGTQHQVRPSLCFLFSFGIKITRPEGHDTRIFAVDAILANDRPYQHRLKAQNLQFIDFLNGWLVLKHKDHTIEKACNYRVLGHGAGDPKPRWSWYIFQWPLTTGWIDCKKLPERRGS